MSHALKHMRGICDKNLLNDNKWKTKNRIIENEKLEIKN